MNKIEEIKKKIRDLKLKQKMTTGRLEWNDIHGCGFGISYTEPSQQLALRR